MNATRPPTPFLKRQVQAAWQAQLVAPITKPVLVAEFIRRRHELPPPFEAYYSQLKALPRWVRRALHRQWRQPLAVLALWLVLGQLPALAATIAVGGACTLVDAITAANADAPSGGCPAGSGADTIVLLAKSVQTLTNVNNNTHGPTGLPMVSSVITIAGQGSTIARASEAPDFRLFTVGSTGNLTLQETMVSGGITHDFPRGSGVGNRYGTVTIINSTISGNEASDGGGGVGNRYGIVTITNSTISGGRRF